jgi:hypothetical protein
VNIVRVGERRPIGSGAQGRGQIDQVEPNLLGAGGELSLRPVHVDLIVAQTS